VKCPNCNSEIDDDVKFCSNCGFKTKVINLCPICGIKIESGIKFCGNCGSKLNDQINRSFGTISQTSTLKSGSTKQRVYSNKASQLNNASEIVKNILDNENLEYQEIPESNAILIQARKAPNIFKTALGLEIAASIKLSKINDDLVVDIGGGKWIDKAAGGAIFLFVFWPTIITTAWGIYIQQQLFMKIDNALIANLV
jgi:predicted nucleic acid-binding Zn ribbon protein